MGGYNGESGRRSLIGNFVNPGAATLDITTVGDFGATGNTKTVTVLLTGGSLLRKFARAEESGLSGIRYAHWMVADTPIIGDGTWTLDTIVVPVTHHEALSR